MRIRSSSIRLRLTVWYTLVLAFIVVVFSVFVYLFVRGRLFQQLDQSLDEEYAAIAGEASEEPRDVQDPDSENSAKLFLLAQGKNIYFKSRAYQQAGLPELREVAASRYQTLRSASNRRFRVVTGVIKGNFLLTVAIDEEATRRSLRTLLMILVIALPSALVLAAAGGHVLASRLLRPVASMAAKAKKISAENLSERLPVDNPDDELGKLAGVFNQTLADLENAFERLERFTADASHELRAPLTAIESVGEVALQETLDVEAYRDRIGSMLEETSRLTHLVESLLLLTRVDRGRIRMNRKDQDVSALVEKAVEDLRVMAEEKGQTLVLDLKNGIRAVIDDEALRTALVNLLDNAIKYTPEGGTISVRLTEGQHEITVEVTDTGPGIALEHREKIFDRFYRVEKDRPRDPGGAGLGLAIAKASVEASGGRLELASHEGQGSTFRIVLPR